MKTLLLIIGAAFSLGAARMLAPTEGLLHPQLVSDLAVARSEPVRTTVTLVQQWVPRRGGMALAGYTPAGEAVTVYLDEETERPARMGAEATYDVVGDATGKSRIKARRMTLVKHIPIPHDTLTVTLDDSPRYERTVGHWHQFSSHLHGDPVRLAAQGVLPGKTVTGYWSNETFVVVY